MYGVVPPWADITMVPVVPVVQLLFIIVSITTEGPAALPTEACVDAVHPWLSVTVTLYVPTAKPLMLDVVAAVDHK